MRARSLSIPGPVGGAESCSPGPSMLAHAMTTIATFRGSWPTLCPRRRASSAIDSRSGSETAASETRFPAPAG